MFDASIATIRLDEAVAAWQQRASMRISPPVGLGRAGALALLITMGSLWGLQFAMLKLAAQGGHSDINILMLTLVLLSIIFSTILIVRRELFSVNGKRLVFLVVTAMLGYVAPLAAALQAAPHIPAGILTMLASLAPVITILVAIVLRTEAVSLRRLAALILGACAVLMVFSPELDIRGLGMSQWLAVALVVPLCYGVESVYIAANWPKGMTTLQAITGETLIATLLIVPFFAVYGEPVTLQWAWSDTVVAISVFVLAGVFESLIYLYLIRTTGGVFVSFGAFVSLFAGIAWGMVLFSEAHSLMVWAAVAILCIALVLAGLDRPVSAAGR